MNTDALTSFINANPEYKDLAENGIHTLYYYYIECIKKTLQTSLADFSKELMINEQKDIDIEKEENGHKLELFLNNSFFPLKITYSFDQRDIDYSDININISLDLERSRPYECHKSNNLFVKLVKSTELTVGFAYDNKRYPMILIYLSSTSKPFFHFAINQSESYKITKINYNKLFIHIIELLISNPLISNKLGETEIKRLKSLKTHKFFEEQDNT